MHAMGPSQKGTGTNKGLTTSKLNVAFVTGKNKKPKNGGNSKDSVTLLAKDIDVRDWPLGDRQLIGKGVNIKANEILDGNMIHLPAGMSHKAIHRVANQLQHMATTADRPGRLRATMNFHVDLATCAVSKQLGLEKYTEHIFKMHYARLNKYMPTYKELNAITRFSAEFPGMFSMTASYLAQIVRENNIPDPEDFDDYLSKNLRLADAMKKVDEGYWRHVKNEEEHKRRLKKAEEDRIRREEAKMRYAAQSAERVRKTREKAAASKEFWNAKKEQDTKLEKGCQAKIRSGERKFTPKEARHWERTRGRRPPKHC